MFTVIYLGNVPILLVINKDHLPENNGIEHYGKRYTYSDDGRNLLLEEKEDNGLTILYHYAPGTPLLSAKYIVYENKIRIRQFWDYNEDRIAASEVIDNGSQIDRHDLRDVTQRKIKRTYTRQTNPFIGMPESIEEKYLDLKTGQEKLLKKIAFFYSPHGKIERQEICDSSGNYRYCLTTTYDKKDRPFQETNAIGQTATSYYDVNGNKVRFEDFSGQLTTLYTYDFSNRLIKTEEISRNGIHHATHYEYDYKGNRIALTDPLNNRTEFSYDSFGNTIATKLPKCLDEKYQIIQQTSYATYDPLRRPTSFTTPSNETTHTQYNARGKPIFISYPDGTTERMIYHLDGTLKKTIDQEGTITTYDYDFLSRVTCKSIFSPQGELLIKERFEYDAFNLLSYTNAEGNITYYFYDSAGRKIAEEFYGNNDVERSEFSYDTLGRLHSVKRDDLITITEYDLLDRLIEERYEDISGNILSKMTYEYDAAGNQFCITREIEGRETKAITQYDDFKRPILNIDAFGQTSTIVYDEHYVNSLGQTVLRKIHTDPLGIQTIEIYDALGRLASSEKKNVFQEQIAFEEFYYDQSGNLSRQLSKVISSEITKNVETHWNYGPLNRLSSLSEAYGTREQKTTYYTYTPKGLIRTIEKPDGTILWHDYDALGRLISLRSSDHSCEYTFTYNHLHQLKSIYDPIHQTCIERDYDAKGRLIDEKLSHGPHLTNTYDTRGRRISLQLPDGSSIQYHYDPLYLREVSRYSSSQEHLYTHRYTRFDRSGHLLEQELIGNLGTTIFHLDPFGRTSSIRSPFFSEEIKEYDRIGNIKKIHFYTPFSQDQTSYDYDDLRQLKSEQGFFSHILSYDSHYNRLKKDNRTYSINDLNQLISYEHSQFTYDKNGNPILKHTPEGDTHYRYDALDRLIEITQPQKQSLHFTYDGLHRRISKTTFLWQDNQWQKQQELFFLYDDEKEIGAQDASGTIVQLRILGSTPQAEIGASVAIELNNEIYAPIHDLSGNITVLISVRTRQIEEHYRYNAFGEEKIFDPQGQLLPHSILSNPWRFSSKRIDEETSFIFYGRRYYDPSFSRWLTPDPQGFTDSPNLYAFLLNDPLTHVDLYGLEGTNFGRTALNTLLSGITSFSRLAAETLSAAKTALGDLVGRVIHQFFFHLIPLPVARDWGMLLGNSLIKGEKLKNKYSSSKELLNPDCVLPVAANIDVNGMLTKEEEAKARSLKIKEEFSNVLAYAVYNGHHGFAYDLGESVIGRLGARSHPVDLLVECIRDAIGRLGGTNTNKIILLRGFSQGGIIIEKALSMLTQAEKNMIVVRTYGSGALFAGQGLRSCAHNVSIFDPVPLLSDTYRYMRALASSDSNVHFFYNKRKSPFKAHSFEAYEDLMKSDLVSIKEKYGWK